MTEDPETSKIHLDARNLRGIAHPVRVRIIGLLRTDGPATATGLARLLGLNTGATSYHLRQLADNGFIVEDAERGTGRERWWKAAYMSTTYDSTELDGDDLGVGEAYVRSVVQVYADRMLRAVDDSSTLPEQWRSKGTFSDVLLR
ncbi:MAG: helix-turn-helix domain-containing protein, partial [Stackebrandtia sp.]